MIHDAHRRVHQDFRRSNCRTIRSRALIEHRRASISQPLTDFPEARAFWWPRFLRIARWFAGCETARRAKLSRCSMPRSAASIAIPFGERRRSSSRRAPTASSASPTAATPSSTTRPAAPPTEKQVRTGLSPQLTLEAAILRQGGFKDIAGRRVGRASLSMCGCAAAPIAGEAMPDRLQGRHADDAGRPRAGAADRAARQVRRSGQALLLAAASDVDDALRHLRPPRAREGMVGRRRRGDGRMTTLSPSASQCSPNHVRSHLRS